jgi:hypothetical protein
MGAWVTYQQIHLQVFVVCLTICFSSSREPALGAVEALLLRSGPAPTPLAQPATPPATADGKLTAKPTVTPER